MPLSDEAFAQRVQHMGLASTQQIEAARQAQAEERRKGLSSTLAFTLTQMGVLSPEACAQVEDAQVAGSDGGDAPGVLSDEVLARHLLQNGGATLDQLEEAKRAQAEQARQGRPLSLGQVLVTMGVLTPVMLANLEKRWDVPRRGALQQVGQYKLLKKLGEGGMGAVYLAEDTHVQRRVAVKILAPKLARDHELLSRFRREAIATGKLNHENIVAAYTFAEDGGVFYYAMEYCEGEPLDKFLERVHFLPEEEALRILVQVARGLQYAHEHGVIHRDIKPANVFVTKDGVAKVLDLGLSKQTGMGPRSFTTMTGILVGTPHYMSPEQARGEKQIDGRSDIYSLGAMFYHLVTGETPFDAPNVAAIFFKQLTEQLPNPQDLNPELSDGAVQVITRMMAREPADRYRDCKELLRDLELVADGKTPGREVLDAARSSVAVRRGKQASALGPALLAAKAADARDHKADVSPAAPPVRAALLKETTGKVGRLLRQFASVVTKPRTSPLAFSIVTIIIPCILLVVILATNRRTEGTPSAGAAPEPQVQATKPATNTGQWATSPGPDPSIASTAQRLLADVKLPQFPKDLTLDLGGGVKMEMVLVPAGEFDMGSNEGPGEERPVHKVKISKPFYTGKYEVTVAQFRAFVDATKYQTEAEKAGNKGWGWDRGWKELTGVNWKMPNFPPEGNYPVCLISWDDAQEFVKWASKQTGRKVSLPSEAQWEYACRAGTTAKFNLGDQDSDLEQAAWFRMNSGVQTNAVGQKKPNAWGLYDMHGNVWEWCADWYANYSAETAADPQGPEQGQFRVQRGGSWISDPGFCRSAYRASNAPDARLDSIGFRVVGSLPGASSGGSTAAIPAPKTDSVTRPESATTASANPELSLPRTEVKPSAMESAGALSRPMKEGAGAVVAPKTPGTLPEAPKAATAGGGESALGASRKQFDAVLKELEPLLAQSRLTDAMEYLDRKANDPALADAKGLLAKEKADIEAVMGLRSSAAKALQAQVGQAVTLMMGNGTVTGKVLEDPRNTGVTLDVNGAKMTVAAERMHPEDVDRYAPRLTKEWEDLRRRGLLFLYAGNMPKAKEYLTKARDAGLEEKATPYLERLAPWELTEAEGAAQKAWERAEKLFAANDTKGAKAAYDAFKRDYASTPTAAREAAKLEERLAALEFSARKGGRGLSVTPGGGDARTEEAVTLALRWLARNQEADGHWDTKKYESNEKTDTACTGFALLAFLGAGHTEKVGLYQVNVRRAVAWLKSKQNADGLIFDSSDAGAFRGIGYPHAIAGLAMAEAARTARIPETIAAAQKAIDYSVQKHQNGEGYEKRGFRYNPKQDGDLSVTSWFVQQLHSARLAGLAVNRASLQGVAKFLDSVESKGAGGDKGYGAASVYKYRPDDAAESRAHRLTAIGNLCRRLLGWKKEDLEASVQWAIEKGGLPDGWGGGKTDLYYWYFGTMCAFQQGGDIWKRWNEAMKRTLCDNQRKRDDENGSWDGVGEWSNEWGRVGQTALCCLCLEVYYRYPLPARE